MGNGATVRPVVEDETRTSAGLRNVVEIVCELPGIQFSDCAVEVVVPSTVMLWPGGEVCTVMATVAAGAIPILQLAVIVSGVPEVESTTFPVNQVGPAVSGVPVIAPVDEFRTSGVGSAPVVMEYVYDGVPPEATSDDEYATPTWPELAGQVRVSGPTAGLIVMVQLVLAVPLGSSGVGDIRSEGERPISAGSSGDGSCIGIDRQGGGQSARANGIRIGLNAAGSYDGRTVGGPVSAGAGRTSQTDGRGRKRPGIR